MSPAFADVHRAVEGRLNDRDQRYNANRRRIVEALAEAASPLTMPELLRRRPSLTQSSTYRNLAALEEAEVVRRVVSGSEHAHFELAEDLTEHHHHLVCMDCGSITDVTLEPPLEARLERAFDVAAEARGFRPAGHSIDIYGRCAACVSGGQPRIAATAATTARAAKITAATLRSSRSGSTRSSD